MAAKYSLLVIKYPYVENANAAFEQLHELQDEGVVKLRDAVVVTKNEKGKVKLQQTKDDSIGKGFVKGGAIGVLFAILFGPAGWIAMGAAAGGLFAGFDRGIKNKLLKGVGQDMNPPEAAVAILVEDADWQTAFARMRSHGYGGQLVVSEIVAEDMDEVDRLLNDPGTAASVPQELEIVGPAVVAAAAVAAADSDGAEAVMAAAVAEPVHTNGSSLRIADVEGIGPAYAEKLAAVGIKTTDDLLTAGKGPAGRTKVAADTGISEKLVLEWVNNADLMRIPGIGTQYSDLLEAAGVDSPAELTHRNAANLATTFQEVVAARPGTVRRIPTETEIAGWIDAAGKLEKVVEH
jgi:uncharacterized membrane protein